MPQMIAKVTVVTGLHKVTKQPVSVAPGTPFEVKSEAEAAHLFAIDAADYAAAPEPAPATPEGGEA